MSAFDEYRKKLQGKYGSDSKYIPGGTAGRGKGRDTSADTEQRKRFDEYRNELKSKYNSKNYMANSEQGIQGWKKYLDDKTKAEQEATAKEESKSWWEKGLEYLGGVQDTTLPMGSMPSVIEDLREDQSYRRPSDDWSEEEQRTFGYKYMIDPEQAYNYAQEINISKAQAKEDTKLKEIEDSATSGFLSGALHTAGSTLTQPFGLVDYMSDLMHSAAGRPIMPDGDVSPFEYSQAVTSGISTHLNEEYGTIDEDILIIGGKGWGDAYGLAKSTGESFGYGAAFGKYGTLINYFGISAAAGVDEAKKNGATDDQALTYGALLGTFEALAESIGIEKLFKIKSSSTLKGLAKNILKQAWSEGAEEGLTTALSNVADAWVLQDSGNLYKELDYYMSQGMSEEDAKWKVFWNSLEGIAYDSLGGFVSGAAHAGLQTGIQTGVEGKNLKQQFGDGSKLVSEALENSAEGSDLRNLAEKYQGKLDGGKSLSGTQLIELNEAIASNDETLIKKAALRRLGELGETNDVTPIAETLVKLAKGEKLTSKEVTILNESKAGHIVASEINKKNIQSGGLGNTWAENIGTRRISPESYNKQFYNEQLYDLAKQVAAKAAEKASVDKKLGADTSEVEKNVKVAESGKTIYRHGNDAEDVTIKRVVSTKGGLKVELDNGNTVSVKDLEFATAEEGIMYEMVARMEVSPGTANEILSTFKPANGQQATYLFNAIPLAYQYGKIGYEAGLKNINLSDKQKRLVYNRGRMDAITESKTKPGKATASNTEKGKLNESNTDKGESTKKGIIFEDGLVHDEATANEMQKKGVIGAEVITKMTNLEVHMFASEVDENGNRVAHINGKTVKVAPNGFFKGGNKIYIDYNAGDSGEGAILYTLSHEATHYIREWNAEGFKELADYLIEQYGKNGVSVDALLEVEKESLKEMYEEEGKTLPSEAELNDMAYEELVADAMSDMFADPKAYEKLADFKKKHYKVWKKLGEIIRGLLDKLKGALGIYKKDAPVSEAADEVRNFSADVYEKLQDLYIKAFVKADANYEAASKNGTAEKYLRNRDITYNLRAKKSHQEKLADQYSKDASVDLDTLMQRYNKIISIWESLGGELNSKFLTEWNNKVGKDRAFTVFKAQAGYKYNVELSSMCKKGVPLFEAIDTIVKQEVMKELNTDVLGKEEKEILYDLLKSHDFEIPCAICYVEQARQREGVIIDSFLNGKVEKNNAGKVTTFKLGWNEVLKSVEKEMKELGVDYTFPSVDRNIATDNYTPADITMDEATQNAFYNALKKVANKEIARYNKAEGKNRKFVTTVTPSAIKEVFKGTLPSNLKIFKVLFTEPSSRLTFESDLLYSSLTTHNLATAHNALYSLFNSQGGVSGYKTKQGTVVYWGDILGKTWTPAKVRDEGGIRNQSNSDFQMYTLLDQAQMYIDFTAKGYYLQAYTKVLSELKLFGLSRGKINASLIPAVYEYRNADGSVDVETTRAYAGLDKDGNLLFDDIEGINHKEAFMLLEDAEYSKSIGGICIGYSDEHILKLLDDSRIQQIIGFHDKTDDPNKRYRGARYAKNYNGLNEAINNKDGKTVHIGFNPFIRKAEKKFTFNSKTETYEGEIEYNGKTYVADDIPKLAADMYLKMCEEKDYTPAYTDFDFHENYYKLLADFSLYDSEGHYAPHRKVAYNMPDKVPYLDLNGKKQYMSSKDYIKAELEKELKVRDSISEALADKSENGLIPQFVKRVNESKEIKYDDRESSKSDYYANEVKITADMSEDERYEVLKKRSIKNIPLSTEIPSDILKNITEISSWDDVNQYRSSAKKNLIRKLAKEFKVFGKEYLNKDINLSFEFSRNNFDETYDKQKHNYVEFAKMFSVFEDVIESAVGIEIHNRTYYKPDPTLDNVFVLMSAYQDGNFIVPVKLEVKQFKDKQNTLYVVISLEKIKMTEVLGQGNTENGVTQSPRSVNISIARIFAKINPYDKNFLKYIPDGFLDSNQKVAKQEALREDADKAYMSAVKRNDMQAAQRMVDEAAREAGYTTKAYHGTPNAKTERNPQWEKAITEIHKILLPNDNPIRLGEFGSAEDKRFYNFVNIITLDYNKLRADVRAKIPKNLLRVVRQGHLRNFTVFSKEKLGASTKTSDSKDGFFFTQTKEFAQRFRATYEYDSLFDIKTKTSVGDGVLYEVFIKPDATTEFRKTQWQPDGKHTKYVDEIVVKNPNQIKSADPVTYDDNGNVIPLSERFNTEDSDIRYSLRGKGGVSTRTLLANALESAAQNDIEKNKLKQYKDKIALIESEQAKLNEIREKANALRFTKGRTPNETKMMRDLDTEANQIANRISTWDKQLLNLESTTALKNVLNREKALLRKKLEQKSKESLKAQREKDAKTVRELMARHQESRHKAVESRNKTEARHRIQKVVSDLNKLLLNPTKDQHVPIGLQLPVAEALDAINMDSMNAGERVAYYNDLISKSSDPDEIAMLTKKRDFFEYRDANFKERITALKNAYAEFKESDDPLIRNAHNEAIEDLIRNTADAVGNKSLKDMSLEQLEAVYSMYKAILATVRNSNKLFKEGKQETITETSETVKTEVREVGGHRERILKLAKFFKKFGWGMLKPITAMKVIGSNTFAKLFDNVRAGEDTWAIDVNEAKVFYDGISAKYGYKKWDFDKRYTFKDSRGEDFSLSLEQIMSLYAYSKRDQADKHLEFGGFIFDDAIEVTEKKLGVPLKYEVNDANPYRLRKEDLFTVIEALSNEQKGFVNEMQAYLSDVMGAKGNEVSLAMYDIKLYTEKNYFPLKTSRYFREFDPEKSATPKVKNAGFSKKTVPQAGNPIVLSNFMDVWANHVNDMSMYHAFVLPLEDFMRVYNYSSTAGGYDSVQQYIKNAYGAQANQYIEKLMNDLNGGARVDPSADVINKGISLFKKASVFASASVVVQQPSAIARAFAYINPKYFGKATPSAMNLKKHKALWEEVKRYAPVAVIKEMGYFDTGMGRSTVEWIKGNKTVKDKIDDALSIPPAKADELSWTYIWEAVKRETEATTNIKVGSEEFLKKSGERFTEIITNTQVYDSVLSRSDMMRSKDTGMKMATAFMAEPTTTVNMMVDGIIQAKRGNKKFLASTVGAVSASIILNSILVALVYAARDDDEDETYAEKYIGSLTSELLDGFNPLTYIPFVKDIWSIMQGYDVERSDMSVVSKLWESIEGMFKEDKSGWEKVLEVAGSVSSLFGVPLKNIIRDTKGMYNLAENVLSDTETTRGGIGDSIEDSFKSSLPLWDRIVGADSKSDNIYEAIMNGDSTYVERLKKSYKTSNEYESAVKSAFRENDPRIKEAAQARLDGDISKYTRIAKEIIREGNFSQDIIVGAINAEISAIKRGESSESGATEDKDEVTSIYSASDINVAFDKGNSTLALEIIDNLVKTKVANGMEEKNAKSSIRSSMTSYWKPLYKQAYKSGNATEMSRIRMILHSSGLYGTGNDVIKTVRNWLKD